MTLPIVTVPGGDQGGVDQNFLQAYCNRAQHEQLSLDLISLCSLHYSCMYTYMYKLYKPYKASCKYIYMYVIITATCIHVASARQTLRIGTLCVQHYFSDVHVHTKF